MPANEMPASGSTNPNDTLAAKAHAMNSGINALKGGRRRVQRGGDVPCCDNSNPYSYPCPAGMCGPIAQVPNAMGQQAISSAASTLAMTNANAEFDTRPM